MLRLIYTLLFALATPLILGRLWWRGQQEPRYRHNIAERFGHYSQPPLINAIWIHAVSVGEVRAAAALLAACEKQVPQSPILITCMTPTGRATALELFGHRATIAYLPYDLPIALGGLLAHFRPRCLLIMETEIWFNLVAVCRRGCVPVLLVNGRLSARSRNGYAKFAPIRALTREALAAITVVAAQSAADAARFSELGAHQVVVTGNMKFDLMPDGETVARGLSWRASMQASSASAPSPAAKQHVLLAASTREGEEAMLLNAFCRIFDMSARRDILLVIAPRHPQRFNAVLQIIMAAGLSVTTRSANPLPANDIQVWLGDSMGEMAAYYALCDVAIIGGSFVALGGQNLIEAASLGKPTIVGPHVFNFSDAVRLAKNSGALMQVADADSAMRAAQSLFNDPLQQRRMGEAALQFTAMHRGATQKTMGLITDAMNPIFESGL